MGACAGSIADVLFILRVLLLMVRVDHDQAVINGDEDSNTYRYRLPGAGYIFSMRCILCLLEACLVVRWLGCA